MRNIKYLSVFVAVSWFCVLILPGSLIAQSSQDAEVKEIPKNVLAIVPQYAIFKGIRIDYERKLKSDKHWIVIAPQFYLDINNPNYYYSGSDYGVYTSMTGIGLNMYYKTIVYQSKKGNANSHLPRHTFYVSAGPNFQYFSLENSEEVAQPYTDNGITYYQYDIEEVKKPIYRVGAIADAGWQMAFDRFLLDIYLGVGLKYSMDGSGELITGGYADWVDPYYSGILLDGGLRVGLFF